jgi:hypothetical protein
MSGPRRRASRSGRSGPNKRFIIIVGLILVATSVSFTALFGGEFIGAALVGDANPDGDIITETNNGTVVVFLQSASNADRLILTNASGQLLRTESGEPAVFTRASQGAGEPRRIPEQEIVGSYITLRFVPDAVDDISTTDEAQRAGWPFLDRTRY